MTREETAMDVLKNFLNEAKWDWAELDAITFRGVIGGGSGRWGWLAHCHNDGEFLSMLSTVPQNVPANRRRAAMEYLTRANYQMTAGTFEMDLSDGQVNCRTEVPADGLTAGGINFLVFSNFMLMDRYMPGLLSVIYGKISPVKAIEMVEAAAAAPSPDADTGERETPLLPAPETNGNAPMPKRTVSATRRRRLFPGRN